MSQPGIFGVAVKPLHWYQNINQPVREEIDFQHSGKSRTTTPCTTLIQAAAEDHKRDQLSGGQFRHRTAYYGTLRQARPRGYPGSRTD